MDTCQIFVGIDTCHIFVGIDTCHIFVGMDDDETIKDNVGVMIIQMDYIRNQDSYSKFQKLNKN